MSTLREATAGLSLANSEQILRAQSIPTLSDQPTPPLAILELGPTYPVTYKDVDNVNVLDRSLGLPFGQRGTAVPTKSG